MKPNNLVAVLIAIILLVIGIALAVLNRSERNAQQSHGMGQPGLVVSKTQAEWA